MPAPGRRVIERNVLSISDRKPPPFFLRNLVGSPDPDFKAVGTGFNLFWNPSDPNWADAHLTKARAQGQELHSLVGDPLFREPEKGISVLDAARPLQNLASNRSTAEGGVKMSPAFQV